VPRDGATPGGINAAFLASLQNAAGFAAVAWTLDLESRRTFATMGVRVPAED